MKSLVFIIFAAILATGCSTAKHYSSDDFADQQGKTAQTNFLESYGPLKLVFNEKGVWTNIETSATAPVTFDADEGREVAFKIATMRAKRNLVEFISNDLKSSKSLKSITNSYLKSIGQQESANSSGYVDDEDEGSGNVQTSKEIRQKANTIATTLRENIADNAQTILKGVYVSERKVSRDGSQVSVTIAVSRKSMTVAESLRRQMTGI
jgi:hypothetical protein